MKFSLKGIKESGNVRTLKYIISIFIVTRIILTLIGVSSRIYFEPIYEKWHEWHFSDNVFLDIWGVWDTGWYMDIARGGYSLELRSDLPKKVGNGQNNLGFFPMYPMLIKGLSFFTGDLFVAGIVISNICLILAAFVLYKLTQIKYGEKLARYSTFYLFLFPTGFILTGVFSESMFLLFLLLMFYFAERKRFVLSAVSGFFMAATRFTGIFMLIPILFKYFETKKFSLKNFRGDVFFYILVILPSLFFGLFTLTKFGDFFAYYHAKGFTWGLGNTSPLNALWGFLTSGDPSLTIISIFFFVEVIFIFYFRKKIETSYFLLSLIFIGVPCLSDYDSFYSVPRYSLAAFPLFIILALASKPPVRGKIIVVALSVTQAFFMTAWVNGALIR